ncbi:MAG: SRPBCC domain-containing protein [Actinomycetota bacterium]
MADEQRTIEQAVAVDGTPDEVWRAIATGPGISSWYVPHTVVEETGGRLTASFGPGMDVAGRVAVWDPPRRLVLDGGDEAPGLTFDWTVSVDPDGACTVQLVNGGFGTGADAHYDAMTDGWATFLTNLRLHLRHHRGASGVAALPMVPLDGERSAVWARFWRDVGVEGPPTEGQRLVLAADDAPTLVGTVEEVTPWRVSFVLDEPTPGTAFISIEDHGERVAIAVWTYHYGPDAATAAERCQAGWGAWLEGRSSGVGG